MHEGAKIPKARDWSHKRMRRAQQVFRRWNRLLRRKKDEGMGRAQGAEAAADYEEVKQAISGETQQWRVGRVTMQTGLELAGLVGPFSGFELTHAKSKVLLHNHAPWRFGRRTHVADRHDHVRRGLLKGSLRLAKAPESADLPEAGFDHGDGLMVLRTAAAEHDAAQAMAATPPVGIAPLATRPCRIVARLYVLRGQNLAPADLTLHKRQGKSDPYIRLRLGGETVAADRAEHLSDVVDADFYRVYEVPVQLPGPARLAIDVMDHDPGISAACDDLIGTTVIDLEDRWLDPRWHGLGSLSEDPEMNGYRLRHIEKRSLYLQQHTPQPESRWELRMSWKRGRESIDDPHMGVAMLDVSFRHKKLQQQQQQQHGEVEDEQKVADKEHAHERFRFSDVGCIYGTDDEEQIAKVLRKALVKAAAWAGSARGGGGRSGDLPGVHVLRTRDSHEADADADYASATTGTTSTQEEVVFLVYFAGPSTCGGHDVKLDLVSERADNGRVRLVLELGRLDGAELRHACERVSGPATGGAEGDVSREGARAELVHLEGARAASNVQPEATRGELECWLDIMTAEEATRFPRVLIAPPPDADFEVRVVVWKTRRVQSEDMLSGMNDLYLRVLLQGADSPDTRETDTHYRLRTGKGSFNYRSKFDVTLGHRTTAMRWGRITVQAWDRDLMKYNDFIAESIEDLTPFYRMAWLHHVRVHAWRLLPTAHDAAGEAVEEEEEEEEGGAMRHRPGRRERWWRAMQRFWRKLGRKLSRERWEQRDLWLGRCLTTWLGSLVYLLCLCNGSRWKRIWHTRPLPEDRRTAARRAWWFACAGGRALRVLATQLLVLVFYLVKGLLREGAAAFCGPPQELGDYEQLESEEHAARVRESSGISRVPFDFVQSALPDPPNSHWLKMYKRRAHEADDGGGDAQLLSDERGEVLVSVDIVPKELAEQAEVGSGQEEPNRDPYLPKPVGRFTWSLNPCLMIYQLLGPKLLTKLLCLIVLAGVIAGAYYVIPVVVGNRLSGR